jgi:hypothetical protein
MLNILYLHHVSAFGGASKSLLTLLSSLKKKGVSATLIAPSGVVADIFENELGIQVVRVLSSPSYSISEHGAYTGRRTVLLYRLFLPLISYLFALIKLRHTQKRFDMIHANEYSMVPAVLLAKLVFGCPVVMHCRSRLTINQRFSTKVVSWLVNRFVHCVISIDSNVHSTVPPHSKNIIIHNAETSFPSLQNIEERYKELKKYSSIKNKKSKRNKRRFCWKFSY